MPCWYSKQNAVARHAPRDGKTYRVLLLARAQARRRKPVREQLAERGSPRPAAAVSAWPLRQRECMDLPLQAQTADILRPSIPPLANGCERSPARPAIPIALRSVPTR